jgi:hypothetical protein
MERKTSESSDSYTTNIELIEFEKSTKPASNNSDSIRISRAGNADPNRLIKDPIIR